MTTDLYEEIAAEQTDDEVAQALSAGDELAMRQTLARIAALGQKRERLLDISATILERYTEKLRAIDEQIDQHRESARIFIQEHNGGESVAFPDVGTGYLTTRKAKAKLDDVDALAAWLAQHDVEVPLKDAPVDGAAALALILAEHKVTATGLLVDGDGEVVTVPGVEVQPESKAFAFRKAA